MELFHVEAEMASLLEEISDKDLRTFAELQEDPANDTQIELFIYVCFSISMRTGSIEYLRRAIERAEGWLAVSPDSHQDWARRSKILDTLSARMCEREWELEGLEELNLSQGG